jgi:hypothetical protein
MKWAAEWHQYGLNGSAYTYAHQVELSLEKTVMWAFNGPPFWLRIGPINWEGKY